LIQLGGGVSVSGHEETMLHRVRRVLSDPPYYRIIPTADAISFFVEVKFLGSVPQ
jgi:hypothetical protein